MSPHDPTNAFKKQFIDLLKRLPEDDHEHVFDDLSDFRYPELADILLTQFTNRRMSKFSENGIIAGSTLLRWEMANEAIVSELIRIMRVDHDEIQVLCASALAHAGVAMAVPVLKVIADERFLGQADVALSTLCEIGDRDTIATLTADLNSSDEDDRLWASVPLARIGRREVCPLLLKGIQNGGYLFVPVYLDAIRFVADNTCEEMIRDCCQAHDSHVRRCAYKALAHLQKNDVVAQQQLLLKAWEQLLNTGD